MSPRKERGYVQETILSVCPANAQSVSCGIRLVGLLIHGPQETGLTLLGGKSRPWCSSDLKAETCLSAECCENYLMEPFFSALLRSEGSSPGEGMDAYKCVVPLKHWGTLNSRRDASPFVRLWDGEERKIGSRVGRNQTTVMQVCDRWMQEVRIAGTLISQRYISDVLQPVVLPYLQGLATAIFQQANARPHVARILQRFFVNHQIELLPWPVALSILRR
ncbi:transposable element Tcb1 transposase [Trichonephila clavipes]|nr:transposable element Tcb1 transposase [Trichonephila clavipes]